MSRVTSGSVKIELKALADGLFATVMTILVLSLAVPTVTGPNTEATLEADRPRGDSLPTLFFFWISLR